MARETIETDTQIKDALTKIYPVLELFHLDGNWPANKTDAIAKAVIVSTKIPAQYRSGLHLNQQIDVTAFASLRVRWAQLLAEEQEWRTEAFRVWTECMAAPIRLEDGRGNTAKIQLRKSFRDDKRRRQAGP